MAKKKQNAQTAKKKKISELKLPVFDYGKWGKRVMDDIGAFDLDLASKFMIDHRLVLSMYEDDTQETTFSLYRTIVECMMLMCRLLDSDTDVSTIDHMRGRNLYVSEGYLLTMELDTRSLDDDYTYSGSQFLIEHFPGDDGGWFRINFIIAGQMY